MEFTQDVLMCGLTWQNMALMYNLIFEHSQEGLYMLNIYLKHRSYSNLLRTGTKACFFKATSKTSLVYLRGGGRKKTCASRVSLM